MGYSEASAAAGGIGVSGLSPAGYGVLRRSWHGEWVLE